MNLTEAKEHIISEGTSSNSIAVTVRMGDDPGKDRIKGIIEAIDVLIENEDLGSPIDRNIAYSLFVIAHETEVQSASWQTDKQWRNGGFCDDLIELQGKVEEYLMGSIKYEQDT